jgi:uncharacterized repeat protein (TIGR01451 family)
MAHSTPAPASSSPSISQRLLALTRQTLGAALLIGSASALAAPGCAVEAPPPPVTSAGEPIVGSAGAVTVTTANTIVNRYSALAANAAVGATSLTVASGATLAPIANGDLLMVMQMQGATIDTTDTATYGTVSALNGAGQYELVTVTGVTGNVITIDAGCGLKNAYSAAAHSQVIWVPQYQSLTVSGAGSIVAPAWNGSTGGVVAIQAETASLQSAGAINVTGLGFQGGVVKQLTTYPSPVTVDFVTANINSGAEKGESIAGFHAEYDASGGRYSIGAPANGGGGGGIHNSGGGGGANGNNGLVWTGAGVMPGNVVGAAAWKLDPAAIAAGGLTNSPGGGRGGYTYAAPVNPLPDPTVVAPGAAIWAGDLRKDHGGLGGRPLSASASQVFLGGGGGAGESNDGAGTSGAPGGGVVVLLSNSVSGAGSIVADGSAAQTTLVTPAPNLLQGEDGPGGGGGGGSIVLLAPSVTGITVSAKGGAGGLQNVTLAEAEGPGGGGGGGFVASQVAVTATLTGGAGGTTNSTVMTGFPRNGATDGATGQAVVLPSGATAPICLGSADLQLTMTGPTGDVAPGEGVTYTITVTNAGPNPATGASLTDPLPGQLQNVAWTCTGTGCPAANGTGNLALLLGSFPPGSTATFTVTGTVGATATGQLSNTASVAPPSGVTDPNLANNSVTLTNPIACNGDNGSGATAACPTADPYCSASQACGKCTSDPQCTTGTHAGPFCDVATGACSPNCMTDAQCGAGNWCDAFNGPGTCLPKEPNGQPLPTGVTCSPTIGGRVCISGVCDTDNKCGLATGDGPCTSTTGSVVCRSGACSTNDTCEPAGGCDVDADCTGGNWCDESTHTCTPKLANGSPLPSDPPHTGPTLNGTCTLAAATLVCTSGVCDTDNACGYANGDGPCTGATGPVVCRSGACSTNGTCEPAGGCNVDADCTGGDWCDESTHTCTPKLANGAPLPSDPPHAGPTLNGMCTTAAATLVCVSGVCDTDNECGYANGDGPCTAANGATVCRSANCSTTGVCEPAGSCKVDADCGVGEWCQESTSTCTPQLPNGAPVPSDPPHTGPTLNGTCTPAAGKLVCVSGVCDTDNECGYADGDGPCTPANATTVCRSFTCSASGTCEAAGACNVDADCSGGEWCQESTHTCRPKLPNGTPVPSDPPHANPSLNGTCTAAAGTLVCESGVCDTDNACGYANGDGPCTAAAQCRSSDCDTTTQKCVAAAQCQTDADCSAGDFCQASSQTCVPKLPAGQACTAADQCQTGICSENVCGSIVGSGNGLFTCTVRQAGNGSDEGLPAGGLGLAIAALGLARRRRK